MSNKTINRVCINSVCINRVCVYCASSDRIDGAYNEHARRLGELLAQAGITVVYGGGDSGSMGAVANAALARGGDVVGVIPRFMRELEREHKGLTELHLVDDMHQRKQMMIDRTDAVVALPGGSGTFEELLEAVTLKRLGLYLGVIVLVNVGGYYDSLLALFERAIAEGFMDPRHRELWSVVGGAEEVLAAIENAPKWSEDAMSYARPR